MNCPSCGAGLEWEQRFAQVTVCGTCKSAVVIDQGAVRIAGEMAALAEPSGPLHLGATGRLRDRRFKVVGRVRYGYKKGFWDEWYLVEPDGKTFWISQDEDNFTLSRQANKKLPAGTFERADPGTRIPIGADMMMVQERGTATCEGGEGQLPFLVLPGEQTPFLDLVAGANRFVTVEFDDEIARLFVGVHIGRNDIEVDFEQAYRDRSFAPASAAGGRARHQVTGDDTASLNCFACGGALDTSQAVDGRVNCEYCGTVNDLTSDRLTCPACATHVPLVAGRAVHAVVCPSCHEQIDTSGAEPSLLGEKGGAALGGGPTVPLRLGKVGQLRGTRYVVTGHIRFMSQDAWGRYLNDEFMLFAEDEGYRWLTLENGHWNLTDELKEPPPPMKTYRKAASKGPGGRTYKYFEGAEETAIWVNGQLPYIAKVGDSHWYDDWIAPPYVLSGERTDDEQEYFLGEYIPPDEVQEAFRIPDEEMPRPIGIAPNQPSPVSPLWRAVGVAGMLFAVLNLGLVLWSSYLVGKPAATLSVEADDYKEEYFTEPFAVSKAGLLEVQLYANLSNGWMAVDGAFVDDQGQAVADFFTEWEYYSGYEGGEHWTEGSKSSSALIKLPRAGTYQLLVKGEASHQNQVTIKVVEGAVMSRYFAILAVVFGLLGLFGIGRGPAFEKKRWGDDDDDD